MTYAQKRLLLRAIESRRIQYRIGESHNGEEVSMLCPDCSPHYSNNRLTLSFNTTIEKWHCWRCSSAKGRDIKSFLLHIKATEYITRIANVRQEQVESSGLDDLRKRLLEDRPDQYSPNLAFTDIPSQLPSDQTEQTNQPVPHQADKPALTTPCPLPQEYRTDFDGTITGRTVLRYLSKTRGLTRKTIESLDIGYAIDGEYAGCAIFPVFMRGELVFWQARRTMYLARDKYRGPSMDKSSILYGYDWFKGDTVYLVEGVFDAIALKPHSMALLGKTITDHHIALLADKQITHVKVVLDADAWDQSREVAKAIRSKLWTANRVYAIRLFGKLDPADLGSVQRVESMAGARAYY